MRRFLFALVLVALFAVASIHSAFSAPSQDIVWESRFGMFAEWDPVAAPQACNYRNIRFRKSLTDTWIAAVPTGAVPQIEKQLLDYPMAQFEFAGFWATDCVGTQTWFASSWVLNELIGNEWKPVGTSQYVSGIVSYQDSSFPFAKIKSCDGDELARLWIAPWDDLMRSDFRLGNGKRTGVQGIVSPTGFLIPRSYGPFDEPRCTTETPAPTVLATPTPTPRPATPTTPPQKLWYTFLPSCINVHSCSVVWEPKRDDGTFIPAWGILKEIPGADGCCESKWLITDQVIIGGDVQVRFDPAFGNPEKWKNHLIYIIGRWGKCRDALWLDANYVQDDGIPTPTP